MIVATVVKPVGTEAVLPEVALVPTSDFAGRDGVATGISVSESIRGTLGEELGLPTSPTGEVVVGVIGELTVSVVLQCADRKIIRQAVLTSSRMCGKAANQAIVETVTRYV